MLARPEYRENAPSLLTQVWNFVLELLGRIVELIVGAGERSFVGTVVVLLFAVLVVFAVARFVSRIQRDPTLDPGLSGATGRAPREWLAEAEAHERAGEWREALRCRYRLLLARLAARGLVDEIPGRTSGEYLAEATAALPAAAPDLRAVTAAFERVWYGDFPSDAGEVRRVAEAVDRVDALASGGRAPALAATGPAPGGGPA